ncbi:hypothetical protein VNO77_23043 [Canavalia gladiata]|uniref:Uncharacterized protein n=1 Tax=Canavalia gladiata TaxID=3824 RepID=A0AAN9QF19_CANGL
MEGNYGCRPWCSEYDHVMTLEGRVYHLSKVILAGPESRVLVVSGLSASSCARQCINMHALSKHFLTMVLELAAFHI